MGWFDWVNNVTEAVSHTVTNVVTGVASTVQSAEEDFGGTVSHIATNVATGWESAAEEFVEEVIDDPVEAIEMVVPLVGTVHHTVEAAVLEIEGHPDQALMAIKEAGIDAAGDVLGFATAGAGKAIFAGAKVASKAITKASTRAATRVTTSSAATEVAKVAATEAVAKTSTRDAVVSTLKHEFTPIDMAQDLVVDRVVVEPSLHATGADVAMAHWMYPASIEDNGSDAEFMGPMPVEATDESKAMVKTGRHRHHGHKHHEGRTPDYAMDAEPLLVPDIAADVVDAKADEDMTSYVVLAAVGVLFVLAIS